MSDSSSATDTGSFTIPDDVFSIVKEDEGKIELFAQAFGKDVEVFRTAMSNRVKADEEAAKLAERDSRIKAKAEKALEFFGEVERFTLRDSVIRLMEKAKALSSELTDDDGDVSISLGLAFDKDGGATVTHRSSGLAAKKESTRTRTSYDYFLDGNKVSGHLTKLLKTDVFKDTDAAKALVKSEAGKGRKSAWDCIEEDDTLKARFERKAKDSS